MKEKKFLLFIDLAQIEIDWKKGIWHFLTISIEIKFCQHYKIAKMFLCLIRKKYHCGGIFRYPKKEKIL